MNHMANWEKLNKELKGVLEGFSDAQWDFWLNKRESKKAMRRSLLVLKAKMQEEKLFLDSLKEQQLCVYSNSHSSDISTIASNVKISLEIPPSSQDYALAA